MASLIIPTGVESHPQISLDQIDLKGGNIVFHWVNGPYGGDCAEPFVLTLAEHGELTINQVAQSIASAMVAKLPTP
jgi:hypothetical protein